LCGPVGGVISTVTECVNFSFGGVGEESAGYTFKPVIGGDEVGEVLEGLGRDMFGHIVYLVWCVGHNNLLLAIDYSRIIQI